MDQELPEGAACMPNLSPGARRSRKRVAAAALALSVLAVAGAVVVELPWWERGLLFGLPFVVGVGAYLEARTHVCVINARAGTFEHDDGKRTAMEATVLPAIRRVAMQVGVKSAAIALAGSALAAATALVR